MKKVYKNVLALVVAMAFTASSFAGQVLVKQMPLGDGITGTGIVRVVVKVADDAAGPDIGVILHEVDPWDGGWNAAMAIMMFDFVKNSNGGLYLAGYNGNTWDWETNVKAVEKGKEIALWLTVDAAGNTHGLSAQIEGEAEVTEVFSGYVSRSSSKGQPSDNAKFCTVFANDRDGQTAESIEVINDAVIVDAIVPYFETSTSITSIETLSSSITVYPTLADDFLNIASEEAINSVKVYSLTGKQVLSSTSTNNQISVADLKTGTYVIEVKTINNLVRTQKFFKR